MPLLSKSHIPYLSFLGKKGTLVGLLAAVLGGSYYVAENTSTADYLKNFLNVMQSQPQVQGPSYINLPHDLRGIAPHFGDEQEEKRWIPWKTEKSHFHWKLLKLAKSKERNVRHMAVKALTEIPNLDDSQYREIAQAYDLRTAVALARTLGANSRFFLAPPHQHSKSMNLETEFRQLLSSLPQTDVSECVKYFTGNAIQSGYPCLVDNDDAWNFPEEGVPGDSIQNPRPRKMSPETVEKFCLQALLSHSTVPNHRVLMVEGSVLQLLYRVHISRKENLEIQSLICRILGNLSLEEKVHKAIFMSGWLGILASWVNSTKVEVSIPANKALANMDRDYSSNVYFEDGIYPLYPQFRGREHKLRADVVFVHGLLGGTFKTWRQHDSKNPENRRKSKQSKDDNSRIADGQHTVDEDHHNFHATLGVVHSLHPDGYTQCWPKDWLAYECPHLRLISVDYDTYVSEWRAQCPVEKNKHTLQVRGNETLEKLIAAGLGERPIIWVAHSMGGILVKQMLMQARKSDDAKIRAIAENTKGVAFYSVPHRGTILANFRPSVERLLQPSVEVLELKQDSPQLLKLQSEFQDFTQKKNLAILSFAETVKSKLGLHWRSLLVTPDSADPGFGSFHLLALDHLSTCKPETHDSPSYRLLIDFLLKYTSHSLIEDLVGPTPTAEDMETSLVIGLVQ